MADAVARGFGAQPLIAGAATDFHAVAFPGQEVEAHIAVVGAAHVVEVGLHVRRAGVVGDDQRTGWTAVVRAA